MYKYKYRYTALGERIACAIVFDYPAMQAAALRLWGVLVFPFPENEVIGQELTAVEDNSHTTRHNNVSLYPQRYRHGGLVVKASAS